MLPASSDHHGHARRACQCPAALGMLRLCALYCYSLTHSLTHVAQVHLARAGCYSCVACRRRGGVVMMMPMMMTRIRPRLPDESPCASECREQKEEIKAIFRVHQHHQHHHPNSSQVLIRQTFGVMVVVYMVAAWAHCTMATQLQCC